MSLLDWFRGNRKPRRVVLTNTAKASPEAARSLVKDVMSQEMGETLARVAVVPTRHFDRCGVWQLFQPHIPVDELENARLQHEVFVFWFARHCLAIAISKRNDASELMEIYDALSYEVRKKKLTDEAINSANAEYQTYTTLHDNFSLLFTHYRSKCSMLSQTDLRVMLDGQTRMLQMCNELGSEVRSILRDLPPPIEVVM
jgi:hypothetical protein